MTTSCITRPSNRRAFARWPNGEDVEFDVELESSGKKRAIRVTGPGGAQVKGAPRQERGY